MQSTISGPLTDLSNHSREGRERIASLRESLSGELERLEDVLYVGRPAFGQEHGTVGLFKLVEDGEVGERVQVRLRRDGRYLTLSLTLRSIGRPRLVP